MKPKYNIGDLVSCVMFDGLWCVSRIWQYSTFFRYEITQNGKYELDIPAVWLTRAKTKQRKFYVVGEGTIFTSYGENARSRL